MEDVRTGKLRDRVDIYESTLASTPSGGTLPVNVLYWRTWANVSPLQSSKTVLANQERLKDGYKITVRYRKDKQITKDLKMFYRGKWVNLTSLDSDDIMKEYVVFYGTITDTGVQEVTGG